MAHWTLDLGPWLPEWLCMLASASNGDEAYMPCSFINPDYCLSTLSSSTPSNVRSGYRNCRQCPKQGQAVIQAMRIIFLCIEMLDDTASGPNELNVYLTEESIVQHAARQSMTSAKLAVSPNIILFRPCITHWFRTLLRIRSCFMSRFSWSL